MKTIQLYLVSFLSLFLFLSLPAQKAAVLYVSSSNFLRDSSIIPADKINLYENFIRKPYVRIKAHGAVTYMAKDALFGYKDKEGGCYRFFGKASYSIISLKEELVLYKTESPANLQGVAPVVRYYFSPGLDSAIYELTLVNLKKAFPRSASFHELLDMCFQHDDLLIQYDTYYNTYKLNRILKLSAALDSTTLKK